MDPAVARAWESVQADFPVNESLIWLNNCGTTPLGRPVLEELERFLRGYSRKGLLWEEKTYPGVKQSIYRRLAALLNAGADEFALVHHTAEGMNFISHGLSLQAGDEILLLENEYPSNYYPWEHWRDKGVVLKAVPCEAGPVEFLAAFQASLTGRTKVAALSAVHWCTGLPLPLLEVGRICAERNIELVVDGAQGVGLLDLDVKACRIGYMAFSAWKWLLGPVGLGVLYVAREKLGGLKPIFKGTESVVQDEGYLPYRTELKPGTDRFSYSTGNVNDWVYFDASLAYLDGIGFGRVRGRIMELAAYLAAGLRKHGFAIHSDLFGPGGGAGNGTVSTEGDGPASTPRTGIVAVSKPTVDSAAAVEFLKGKGIIAAERLGRIRLAPHVYISEKQIDLVIAELGSL